ncbi:MAG: pectate lyase [Planctomycetota bacterium]|jgi:hypothetical protein
MNRLALLLILIAFLGLSESVLASEGLVDEAEAALKKAASYFRSISTNGGYVGIYSSDLTKRYGEAIYEKARPTEIWVQPPGTPTIGQCYLKAWKATGDKFYFEAAKEVAKALVWGQREIGGWDHRVDVSHLTGDAKTPVRKKGRCTFDDNITQGALKFLIEADSEIDERWLSEGVELGLEFMLRSQYENGGWPQWYPLRGGYHDYYTFNDNSINDCIDVMLKAHKAYGKDEYLTCARRGGDFIIASQLPRPQAGWAQQYDRDMKPAWARRFEPPGVCSLVTARNIRTLAQLYLYTKDDKYLLPIPAAIEWLDKSKISGNFWARLYEVKTNRPIYGDREDGNKIHYDYEKVSLKERTSYGWRGEYGIGGAIAYYRKCKRMGPDAIHGEHERELTPAARARPAKSTEAAVRKAIADLDEEGRWLRNDMITCQTFVQNFSTLTRYVNLAKPR